MDAAPSSSSNRTLLIAVIAGSVLCLACVGCAVSFPAVVVLLDQTNGYCSLPFGDQFFYCP